MGIIIWLIVGGICGWLASLIMRTDAQQGIILNIVVGIVGVLPETWRSILSDMFRATLIDGDFARVARGIRSLGYATDYEVDDDDDEQPADARATTASVTNPWPMTA